MSKKLSVIVVCLTPFDSKLAFDEAAYRRQLRRLREAGVSVYLGGGGSGEGFTLTPEERDQVLGIAVEELKGKVPVRSMGTEVRLAREMVDYLRAAERAQVDAAQIFSLEIGHGAKPTLAELDKYYSTVLDSTSLPCVISTHQTAGYFVPIDLLEQLAGRFANLIGIAYGGTDTMFIAELIARLRDRLEIHCAGPTNAISVLALGGNGFMGGEGNFSPLLVASVISAWQAKDMDAVRESFGKLMAFTAISRKWGGSSMRAMKPLMNAYGLPAGSLRPPRAPISDAELEGVIKAVAKLKLPGVPALAQK